MSHPRRVARIAALIAAAFLSPSVIGDPVLTSEFTDVDSHLREAPIARGKEASDGRERPLRLPGPAGYILEESYSAAGTYRQVEGPGGFSVSLLPRGRDCAVPVYGAKLEWRLADGKPVAVITRVFCYGPEQDATGNFDLDDNRTGRFLLVRGLSGQSLAADLDLDATVDANSAARAVVDGGLR